MGATVAGGAEGDVGGGVFPAVVAGLPDLDGPARGAEVGEDTSLVLAVVLTGVTAVGTASAPPDGAGTRSTLASPGTETRTGLAPVATSAAAPRQATTIAAVSAPDGNRTDRSAPFVRPGRADVIDRFWRTRSPIALRDEPERACGTGGGGAAGLGREPI